MTTFMIRVGNLSGRFVQCRAPMGLSPSSDLDCFLTDWELEGLVGTFKSVDAILIQASSLELFEERIHKLLLNLRKHNIMISKSKFVVGSTLEFGGYLIDAINDSHPRIGPDSKRLTGISTLEPPTSKNKVERLLGVLRSFNSEWTDH